MQKIFKGGIITEFQLFLIHTFAKHQPFGSKIFQILFSEDIVLNIENIFEKKKSEFNSKIKATTNEPTLL